jgi:ABC-type sugar transport system substrate-binding protein
VIHILNIIFGFIPTLILGASIAAGVEDDRHHRRTFFLVYGLWSITLAMWNWMRSAPLAWTAIWLIAGVVALGMPHALRASRRHQQRGPS